MAKVLTSLSGNLISAASAGYAPTNSADVSAIASAYQVVSATATQLYAGTAYVTSLNSAPLSASRAGQAANASMATSAYYDGTGRLISALPDAATVSAIASAYADDKLDKTAEVVTATAGDGTYITSINGMGLSGQGGGGGGGVVTATGSASALEGYWPVTTAYLVSSINGSALLPYGYSALSANSGNWNTTRTAVTSNSANWDSVYNTVNSNSASWSGSTGGGSVTSPSATILVMNGDEIEGTNSAVLTSIGGGFEELLTVQNTTLGPMLNNLTTGIVPGTGATLLMTLSNSAYADITVILSGMDPDYRITTASGIMYSGDTTASIPMDGIVSAISASADQWIQLANEQPLTAKHDGDIVVTGVAELAWKSAVDNVTNTVSANSATWGQGGVDSATVSAIASSYAESSVSGVVSAVSATSASWGQSGPVTATASAAASAYTSTSTSVSSFTGVSSLNGSALLVSTMLPNAQQANGDAHFHYMPTKSSPWGSTEYTGVLSPLQYATGACLAMKQTNAYGAYYKGNEWFISDVGSNTAANGVVRAELHRTRGIHLYGSSLNSATGFHLNGSGVNGKSGASAWQYGPTEYNMLTSVHDTVSANSASWTTDLTDYATTAYVDSSVSSKADSSALSSYALSADVSGTVDLVSSQSANWGGSALELSAGPGISLTMVGNTLVISTAGV